MYPYLSQIIILIIDPMQPAEESHLQFLMGLLQSVPPPIDEAIVITTVSNKNYQKELNSSRLNKIYPPPGQVVPKKGVQACYKLSPTQILVDCGDYFLRNQTHPKYTMLTILYFYGAAKKVKILFPTSDFSTVETSRNEIKDILHAFGYCYGNKFFEDYDRSQIADSVGFLIYNNTDTGKNQYTTRFKRILDSKVFSRAQDQKIIEKMLEKVVENKRFITSTNEKNIIEVVGGFSGIKLLPDVLANFLNIHLQQDGDNSKRKLEFEANLKDFIRLASFLIESISNDIEKFFQNRGEKILQDIQRKLDMLALGTHDQTRVEDSMHPVKKMIKFLSTVSAIQKSNSSKYFLPLVKIILETASYQAPKCKLFQFAQIATTLMSIFPYINDLKHIQNTAKRSLPQVYKKILEYLQNICITSQENKKEAKVQVEILQQFLASLPMQFKGECQQYWGEQYHYKNTFRQIINKFHLSQFFTLIEENCLHKRQKYEQTLKFEEMIQRQQNNIDLQTLNQFLSQLYSFIGQELKKHKEYYFAIKCFRQSRSNYSLMETYEIYLQAQYKKKSVPFDYIEEMYDQYMELGLFDSAKRLCYRFMQYERKPDLKDRVYNLLNKGTSNDEQLKKKHKKRLNQDQHSDYEFLDEDVMQAIRKIFRRLIMETR